MLEAETKFGWIVKDVAFRMLVNREEPMPRKPFKKNQGEEAEPTNAAKLHLPIEFTGQQADEEGVETYEKDDRSTDDETSEV